MSNVFGQRIKRRLREVRQTQRWLSNQTEIPESVISNLINGRYENSGSLVHAVPIARVLNTSVDYLFGISDRSERPMYPSRQVRRLATLAEMLPTAEVDKLVAALEVVVKNLDRDGWRTQLNEAVESLLRQHGGDVKATLDALDQIIHKTDKDEGKSSPQLSLLRDGALP